MKVVFHSVKLPYVSIQNLVKRFSEHEKDLVELKENLNKENEATSRELRENYEKEKKDIQDELEAVKETLIQEKHEALEQTNEQHHCELEKMKEELVKTHMEKFTSMTEELDKSHQVRTIYFNLVTIYSYTTRMLVLENYTCVEMRYEILNTYIRPGLSIYISNQSVSLFIYISIL